MRLQSICLMALLAPLASGACAEKWALVIGINDYDQRGITGLDCAVSDAEDLAQALREAAEVPGDHIKLMTSEAGVGSPDRPTKPDIVLNLEWFAARVEAGDTFIFYFAGHGLNRWGSSYLLPIDARTESASVAAAMSLSVDDLRNLLAQIKCAHQIIILDCCRNEPDRARADSPNELSEVLRRDIAVLGAVGHELAGAKSSTVLFSCSSGQRAYERPEGDNGVFTYFLVRGLRGEAVREGEVRLSDLAAYVERMVPEYLRNSPRLGERKQTPWHEMSGSGEVVLAKPPPPDPTQSPPPGPRLGDEKINPKDGAVMVWVPGTREACANGKFLMGSTPEEVDRIWRDTGWDAAWKGLAKHEQPAHEVELDGFWMYKHEVTDAQYGKFLAATGQQRAWLGIQVEDAGRPEPKTDKHDQRRKGAEIVSLQRAPDQLGGLREGDVIVALDHHTIGCAADLVSAASRGKPGQTAALTVLRRGKRLQCRATFAAIDGWQMAEEPQFPVTMVTWSEAKAYCDWAGVDLPTEAQWEWAARGPDRYAFPWGNTWDRTRCNSAEYHAGKTLNDDEAWETWYRRIGGDKAEGVWTRPVSIIAAHLRSVGSFPAGASWCGVHDMAGNVWEWCRDGYDEAFYASASACVPNPLCSNVSPTGHVLRGGAWSDLAYYCRSAERGGRPDARGDSVGLRACQSGPSEGAE